MLLDTICLSHTAVFIRSADLEYDMYINDKYKIKDT